MELTERERVLRDALEEISGLMAAPSSSGSAARIHAALDALDRARDIARTALRATLPTSQEQQ